MSCRSAVFALVLVVLALAAGAASADISGFVTVEGSGNPGTPIAGAYVHIQADLVTPGTFTAADGSFTLVAIPVGQVFVAASIPYLRSAPENFLIGGAPAVDGDDRSRHPPGGAAGGRRSGLRAGRRLGVRRLPLRALLPVVDLAPRLHRAEQVGARSVLRHRHAGGRRRLRLQEHPRPGRDRLLRHLPRADAGSPGSPPRRRAARRGDGAERLAGGHLRRLPPDGRDRRDPHQRAQSPRQGDLPLPAGRPGREHLAVRLGADGRRHLSPDAAVVLAAPPQLPDLRRLPPVPQPDDRRARAEHLPRVAGVALRHARDRASAPARTATWGRSPGVGQNCEFGGPDRESAERHAHTFIGSTPETLSANIALTTTVAETGAGNVRVASAVDNFGAGHDFPTGISLRNAILWITASIGGQPLAQVAGPTVPFWGSDDVPGDQPGDLAGQPGKGFAKVLEGRINGAGAGRAAGAVHRRRERLRADDHPFGDDRHHRGRVRDSAGHRRRAARST